nr:MAG TPA: hypothetical protein [Caudoviricetes sp.]
MLSLRLFIRNLYMFPCTPRLSLYPRLTLGL